MGTKGKVPGHSFLLLDGKGGGPEGHRNRYRRIKGLSNNLGPRREPYYFELQRAILPGGAITTQEPYCLGPQGRQPNPMGSPRQILNPKREILNKSKFPIQHHLVLWILIIWYCL